MKISRSSVLALFVAASTLAAAADERLDMCDFKPVMNENFSSLLVSPHVLEGARWTAHTPWNGDFGDARFVDPGPTGPFSAGRRTVDHRPSRSDGKWRSGLLAAADASGEGTGCSGRIFRGAHAISVRSWNLARLLARLAEARQKTSARSRKST